MSVPGHQHVETPMAGLVELALTDPGLAKLTTQAADGVPEVALVGPAAARLFVASALAKAGPLLVVTATGREADDLTSELRAVLGDVVTMFPSWETLPHERLSPGVETVGARMMVLRRLNNPDDGRFGIPLRVVVTTARSLLQPMAPDLADIEPVILTVGQEAGFDDVLARLVDLAYTRVDMVGKRGEFAVRGGILDVFAPTAEHPVRIEFWGDEVSEMRMFSVADQRTIPELDVETVIAVPCRELLLTEDVRARAAALAEEQPHDDNRVGETIGEMLAKLSDGIPVDGMEALLPVLRPTELTLLTDHLPAGAPVLICDPEKVRTRAADLVKTGREFLEASWSVAAMGADAPIDLEQLGGSGFRDLADVRSAAGAGGHPWWTLSQLGNPDAVELDIRPAPSARGQQNSLDEIFAMLRAHVSTGGHAAIVTPGAGTAHRVVEQLGESDVPATMLASGAAPGAGVVGVLKGPLHDGVVLAGAGLVLITESDLTGNRAAATEGKRLAAKRRNVVDPLALSAGDLVVHDQHGIGRFVEMTERVVSGARREYLVLEYASAKRGGGSDKLFVPMDSLDQLSRYVGGQEPNLSKLGGSDWTNTKTKARKAVREIAGELVALYAKRQAAPGFAFGPDTPWQNEMEDAFGFTETVDQLTAITEVKSDMEKPMPMDRVICGDVGYGKTEIAVRAAFKAVQAGKQVAILVPTTLLADQHLQTFTQRMAGLPGHREGAVALHRPRRVAQGARGHEGRLGRRRHRDAPADSDRRHLEGPRPRRGRRGTAVRRRAQGAHQVDAHPRRRPHDECDAHPAHPGDEPRRHPRDVDDPHPARGAVPGAHLRRAARRQAGRRRASARAAARRPGVLHPQPGAVHRPGRGEGQGAGAGGSRGRRARPDARRSAGTHSRGVLEPRLRHPGVYDDRRDRPGHLECEHADRRARRNLRVVSATSAAGSRRSQPRAWLRLLPVPARGSAHRDRLRPARHDRAEQRARRRHGRRHEGPRDPRRRETCWAQSSPATSPGLASISTCVWWAKRSRPTARPSTGKPLLPWRNRRT